MNSYPFRRGALISGILLFIAFIVFWEVYWRQRGYTAFVDDTKALWSELRGGIDDLDSNGVVLIGSSRMLFDIQLDKFEEVSGIRPVQLAVAGTTPVPSFQDIVENSAFRGTLMVGFTPPLYFIPRQPGVDPYDLIMTDINHYHDRTYADRLNHWLYKPIDRRLAFLYAPTDPLADQLDLRTRVYAGSARNRVPGPPPVITLGINDEHRNVRMYHKVVDDTAYARMITNFWEFVMQPPPEMPPPEIIEQMNRETLELSAELVRKFEARGGRVVFVRFPSEGKMGMAEKKIFGRGLLYDPLIEITGAKGYHFEDYPFMNKYRLPEWSHLSGKDADSFTVDLVKQMKKDGVL